MVCSIRLVLSGSLARFPYVELSHYVTHSRLVVPSSSMVSSFVLVRSASYLMILFSFIMCLLWLLQSPWVWLALRLHGLPFLAWVSYVAPCGGSLDNPMVHLPVVLLGSWFFRIWPGVHWFSTHTSVFGARTSRMRLITAGSTLSSRQMCTGIDAGARATLSRAVDTATAAIAWSSGIARWRIDMIHVRPMRSVRPSNLTAARDRSSPGRWQIPIRQENGGDFQCPPLV
jgi:hypothetical protein